MRALGYWGMMHMGCMIEGIEQVMSSGQVERHARGCIQHIAMRAHLGWKVMD